MRNLRSSNKGDNVIVLELSQYTQFPTIIVSIKAQRKTNMKGGGRGRGLKEGTEVWGEGEGHHCHTY